MKKICILIQSKRLAQDLTFLFQRLGVVSFLKKTYTRATNAKSSKKQEYWKVSIYGDDVVTFFGHIKPQILYKLEKLEKFVNRRLKSKRSSNWDTIPIDPTLFRSVREGLGFTQASSGKPSSVNAIENGYSHPTRPIMNYFINLFDEKRGSNFKNEINHIKFLCSNDIAWDYIEKIEKRECKVPYLYDLSVSESNSFVGNGLILHNTHGHTCTTGAMKNAFGGLIPKYRHHAHKFIHEVLVDLLAIQKEIHPGMLAVMDGTVAGDGAGPRTMKPFNANVLLASQDQVAIDALSAKMMGFDPLKIDYIRIAHDHGLGVGDIDQIEILGVEAEKLRTVNFGFKSKKSLVIQWDQRLRKTTYNNKYLRPLHRFLFYSPFFRTFIMCSGIYHDLLWYPTIGKRYIKGFNKSKWGKLFQSYEYGEFPKDTPPIRNWDPY